MFVTKSPQTHSKSHDTQGILRRTLQCIQAYDLPIVDAIADSGIYYGDASGRRFSSYGPLIRCGVGLVKIGYNTEGNIFRKWGVQMNLPGSVQTVPRAELYALQHLLNEATENANIEFITDTKKNCDTFNKGILLEPKV